MRLSTVFELLLIFLFLALASSRHIDKKRLKKGVTKQTNLNPYCKCSDLLCNCCRDFPVVPIKGPGCASLGYQSGDTLRLTMSYGDRVLRNITLVGKRPKPVCMGLPGGISKFCGRLYNIQRVDDHFKACLSLELRSLDELEAALRVSCFNFGPKGVKLEPGEPLPSVSRPAEDDDDDDDYDIDDDDDDDDEFDDDDDEYNDVDTDGDYTGFAALSDQLFEGFFFPTAESNSNKRKKPVRPVTQETVVEITTKASSIVLNDTKEVSTTEATHTTSTVSSTTQRILETTKGPSSVISTIVTSTSPQKIVESESTETTNDLTDSATESLMSNEDKEAEESVSEEDATEQENDEKDVDTASVVERDEEESNEGSAEDELQETENEETSQAKLEDDDEDDDEDEDDDSDEDQESAEHEDSPEEKDEDNILNVFFNHDDDSTEKERERTRMEREKFKKILPGLMALLQPSPTPPTDDLSASFAYPAVRSARVHRRMRLPPI